MPPLSQANAKWKSSFPLPMTADPAIGFMQMALDVVRACSWSQKPTFALTARSASSSMCRKPIRLKFPPVRKRGRFSRVE
jgi:hypothetical protein